MFESVFDGGDWEAIELRLLRNRVANLFELMDMYDRETGEALAFLMDRDALQATVREVERKKITMMGVRDGVGIWAEESI
jgi:hypothetical protein